MKKTLLILFSAFASLNFANAQVNSYTFAASSGTYTPITGGSLIGGATDDEERFLDPATPAGTTSASTGVGFPIGFSFTFNGQVFDKLGINTNGWICFGKSSLTPSVDMNSANYYTLPLSQTSSATPALLRNRVGGLARDLASQTGSSLRIETIGTSPNKVCVIQWTNYRKFAATGDNFNFQIRLKETSNNVEIVYGAMTNNTSLAITQVGLSGTTNSDFNIRKTSTDWSATTAGAVNTDTCRLSATVKPALGQTYTWTPPIACSGTPTAGTASAVPAVVCSGVNFDLVLTGYTPGVSGLTFQWQSSATSGGTYTNITGATTPTFTTTQTAAMFYHCIVTCSGGAPATSSVVNVTMNTQMNCYCVSTATSVADEDLFNVTVGTLNNSSTCSTTGGTGSTLNEYSNYTALPAPNLAKGTSVAFSIQVGTCGTGSYRNAFKIFIDYNQNGNFADAGERVFQSDTVKGIYTKTGSFTVPTAATVGNTLMRVVLNETTSSSSIDSCGTYLWGETEDYIVNITGAAGIEENKFGTVSIYPNPTLGLFNITVGNANFTQMSINVYDIQGKEVFHTFEKNSSSDFNKQIHLEGLTKGIYYIKLNSDKGVNIQKLIIQ